MFFYGLSRSLEKHPHCSKVIKLKILASLQQLLRILTKILKMCRKELGIMLLKNALELSKSINEDRRIMHEAVQNKGMADPEVRKISQQLDRKIIMLQKMMNEMDSLPGESSH